MEEDAEIEIINPNTDSLRDSGSSESVLFGKEDGTANPLPAIDCNTQTYYKIQISRPIKLLFFSYKYTPPNISNDFSVLHAFFIHNSPSLLPSSLSSTSSRPCGPPTYSSSQIVAKALKSQIIHRPFPLSEPQPPHVVQRRGATYNIISILLQVNFVNLMNRQAELKLKIHEILNRHGFYSLPLSRLIPISKLLQVEEARQPKAIQSNTIAGLIRLASRQSQKGEIYFSDQKYANIPSDIKQYLSAIVNAVLDEYHAASTTNQRGIKRDQLSYPFNPYNYMPFNDNPCNSAHPPLPFPNSYMPYSSPQMYYYRMFEGFSQGNPQVTQEDLPISAPITQPKPTEQEHRPQGQKKTHPKMNKHQANSEPAKKSRRIEERRKKLLEKLFGRKRSLPSRRHSQKELPLKISIAKSESNSPVKPKDHTNKEEKVNLLELKNYNSISDFDYKKFPPSLPAIKKMVSKTVSTQTDYNLIQNDFRWVNHQNQEELNEIQGKNRVHEQKLFEEKMNEERMSCEPGRLPKLIGKRVVEYSQREKEIIGKEMINDLEIEALDLNLLRSQKMPQISCNPLLEVNSSELKMEELQKFDIAHEIHEKHSSGMVEEEKQIHREDNPSEQEDNHSENEDQLGEQPLRELIIPSNQYHHPLPALLSLEPFLESCVCKGRVQGTWLSCISCLERYHCQCLKIEQKTVQFFECPLCKIRNIDPLLEIKDICGEFYVKDLDQQNFKAHLNLAEYQFLNVKRSKTAEQSNEIEMRCIQVNYEENDQFEITWPDETIIKVNNLKVTEFYSLFKTSTLKRRKDAPIIITQSIFKFANYDDEDYTKVEVSMEIKPVEDRNKKRINNKGIFLLGIYYTQKYRVNQLFQKITENIQSCNASFIQSLMDLDKDNEVMLEKEVFKVGDPFTSQLIEFPVRGVNCRHAQCFDLKTYLTLMSGLKLRTWKCPVCCRQAKKFILDHCIFELIQRIVLVNVIPSDIIFMREGNIILKVNKSEDNESSSEEEKAKTKRITKKSHSRVAIKREATESEMIRQYDLSKSRNIDTDIDKYLHPSLHRADKPLKTYNRTPLQ